MQASIKEIWGIELTLLKKLLEVCDNYSLSIWADSGTLLGAIRHKGFIPWDDDIDMVMMRDDYDKLVSISQSVFTQPYFFQTAYSEQVPYPRFHAQLRMDGTTAILPHDINQNFHQGIFIDIFPLDLIPADDNRLQQLISFKRLKHQEISSYAYDHYALFNWRHNLSLWSLRKKIQKTGFGSYFSSIEKHFRDFSDIGSRIVVNLVFYRGIRSQMEKSWYKETLMVPFENLTIPIPIGYHQVLTQQYGDYMTPVKAPSIHGGFAVLDPNMSYKEYLPVLRKQRKRKIWEERFKKLFRKSQ